MSMLKRDEELPAGPEKLVPSSHSRMFDSGSTLPSSSATDGRGGEDSHPTDPDDTSVADDKQGDLYAETAIDGIALRETRQIRVWRLVVVVLLLATGAVLSVYTFRTLRAEQQGDFEDSIGRFQETISEVTKERVDSLFESLRSLGDSIVSHSTELGQELPFIALPKFEVMARATRQRSMLENIVYNPLIKAEQREDWEEFAWNNQAWIDNSRDILNISDFMPSNITEFIWEIGPNFQPLPAPANRTILSPVWMQSPPPFRASTQNLNQLLFRSTTNALVAMETTRDIVMPPVDDITGWAGQVWSTKDHEAFHAPHSYSRDNSTADKRPHVLMQCPVFEELDNRQSEIVGFLSSTLAFDVYLSRLVPDTVHGLTIVLKNSCGQLFTYELQGELAEYLGPGDFHQRQYDHLGAEFSFNSFLDPELSENETFGHCLYSLVIYPSHKFYHDYTNHTHAIVLTAAVAACFLAMATAFLVYDCCVRRRNSKVVDVAAKSNAVVSSLFPSNVRDRVLSDALPSKAHATQSKLLSFLKKTNSGSNVIAAGPLDSDDLIVFQQGTPIAELFPSATIMFADIVEFTAWSSTREPSQVFLLLETLYRSFDQIAKRRKVFKVETIGDSYVAVAGLPERNPNHAVVMARFAVHCLQEITSLMKKLELVLGPGTAALTIRVGLHSGPVTAGVLRGERSRFQLFGDTVNVASRMESTSRPGCVQISQETAGLLMAAGKTEWLSKRDELVDIKGKGRLVTFWINSKSCLETANATLPEESKSTGAWLPLVFDEKDPTNERLRDTTLKRKPLNPEAMRLVEWNVDIMAKLLKQVVNSRRGVSSQTSRMVAVEARSLDLVNILDEVSDEVAIKTSNNLVNMEDHSLPPLEEEVTKELRKFVLDIAGMYGDNAFHNFEHASHVLLSTVKLLSRVATPEEDRKGNFSRKQIRRTYGIGSDPLVHFALAFAALIHDVYHPGVPNSQLAKEGARISIIYKGYSVAEQHSFNVCWGLLQKAEFNSLLRSICPNHREEARFRQLVVNSVMATDIMDTEMRKERDARWEKAFYFNSSRKESSNTKAAAVLEQLIQASDIAHTMQHWHVYRKWNEKLFVEMSVAYQRGRAVKNPADFWYRSEIGFFDLYVIPLATRLVESGVLGVAAEENLKYALSNREEWKERGQSIVQEMVARLRGTAY